MSILNIMSSSSFFKKLFISLGLILTTILFFVLISKTLSENKLSPEISLHSISPLGGQFGKVVAASCAFTNSSSGSTPVPGSGVGHAHEFTDCTTPTNKCPGTSQCGGVCQPKDLAKCISTCPEGIQPNIAYTGYQLILNSIFYYTNTTKPTPGYSLPSCQYTWPANIERRCEIERFSSDGTNTGSWTENYDTSHTIWTNQASKTYPYNEYLKIRCGYWDTSVGGGANSSGGAWYIAPSTWTQKNAAVLHPNYGLPCGGTDNCGIVTSGTYDVDGVCSATQNTYPSCNKTNVCGQVFLGSQCPTGCSADNTFTNDSCITEFSPSTSQVNPNGSVEFSWSVNNLSSNPKCSFVDLTTPTPRPIPGLQNLDPSTDKVRITNIQASTRFCLVCQFFDNITGSLLGEAVKHQWVRVQRIGEN